MKLSIQKEFITYCLVGIVNTIVALSVSFTALNICHWHYIPSTALSYIVSVCVSFVLNKKYTFKDNDTNVVWQFIKLNMTFIPIYILAFWFIGNNLTYCYFRHFPSTADFINDIIFYYVHFKIPTKILIDDIAVCVSILINLVMAFTAVRAFVFTKRER